MKYLVLSIFSAAILTSCIGPSANTDAESVCNCFSKSTRDLSRVDIAVDSCKQLYKKALTDLSGDDEAKKKFVAAYDYCRNN